MNRKNLKAEIILKWGDGEYLFALKGAQIETLEKLCGTGIGEIAHRVLSFKPTYADIKQIIWLGLEGGGMPPVLVKEKVERFIDNQPLAAPEDPSSPLNTAISIMNAAWFGVEDLPKGEAEAGESPAKSSTSESSGPASSDPA